MLRRLLLVVLPVAALLGCAGAQAQEKVTLGSSVAFTQMPNRVGIDEGFFKAQGLDADLKIVPSGNDVIQALAGGSVDFGDASHGLFLAAVSKGLPVVAIGLHSWGNVGKLVAAPQYANLTTLADFKGKRIGVQMGTGAYIVFMLSLDRAGLKASDFQISNVRVKDMPVAMQAKRFDAVMAWEPQATRIVQEKLGKEVISARKFEELADTTYPFLILTTQKMISERPDAVQKYINGFAKAQRFMFEDPKDTVAIYREHLPAGIGDTMSDADLKFQIYSASRYDHIVPNDKDLATLRQFTDFMLRTNMLKSRPDLEKSVNLTFARKAAAMLGK
jgi:aliphatic sulfonates family ABC transporter substrate-binding protein